MLNRSLKVFLPLWSCLLVLTGIGGSGCEPKKLSNGKEIADEVERRLVKRITGPMILQETRRLGDSLVRTAEQNMLTHLKTTLAAGHTEAAQQYRQLNLYPAVTQMLQKYQATLGRTGPVWASPANENHPADLLLQEQLKQYAAFNQQKQTLQPQVIRVSPAELLYTKPIFMNDAICLHCHDESAPAGVSATQKVRPTLAANRAGNLSGNWAGMWFVRFRAKGILDSITQKRKKSRRGQPIVSQPDSLKK